jgi:carboxyl-terminal processing protease
VAKLRSLPELLEQNRLKQAEARAKKSAEVSKELDEHLAKEPTATNLSAALKSAVELHMIAQDKAQVLAEPRIVDLIAKADKAAREAEAKGDWFTANELFFRLSLLLEEKGTYDDDVKRLGHRLTMIRLFVPERFWQLRNEMRLAEGKDPLPPYNGLGEDYRQKLLGVDATMVKRAIDQAATLHVDSGKITRRELLLGGLEFVRTLVTTTDLQPVFPGLADEAARQKMLEFIDQKSAQIREKRTALNLFDVSSTISDLLRVNRETVNIPEAAVVREFGDGAMSQLDDFSGIIWPDEVARFERMTQGKLKGVGIQIQLDEATQMIKVVTPLEGTPAQRAGVKSGDFIKKINGQSAAGISTQQAVDLITGEPNTPVTLTMERIVGKDEDGKDITQDIDFHLVRAVIPLASVKGWKRTGPKEDEWDWFIDPENRIGYIRLLQFQEETTDELRAAIREMREAGLKGLILDLRFNPGGLLSEAVSVANAFVSRGTIVSTTGDNRSETADPRRRMLDGIPLVVLINEGSASASEIVSGAIRYYADRGDIQAILVGQRSYGKGSVQNVYGLSPTSLLKLTTQHYRLPGGDLIHRRKGAAQWGVDPHVKVDMLPEQITQALTLRQDADVLEIDQNGRVVEGAEPTPDPEQLITDGIDLQLHYALVLLQSQTLPTSVRQVRIDTVSPALAPVP